MSRRDPDYLWRSIEVFFTGLGAVIALGVCRLLIAITEWVWR